MPYAYIEDAYTFAVEATKENLMRLAGMKLPVQTVGSSIRAGVSAKGDFERKVLTGNKPKLIPFGRLDKVKVHWHEVDDREIDTSPCNGCRQLTSCVLSGGPSRILEHRDLWPNCGLIGDVSAVSIGNSLCFIGKMFEYPRSSAFLYALDVAKELGFELTSRSLFFRDIDDDEWLETLFVEQHGYSDDSSFTDRFLTDDKHGPRSVAFFDWSDRGERAYRAYKKAQGVATGKKTKKAREFKKAECRECVYTCKPLGHWMVNTITAHGERRKETQWHGGDPCHEAFEPRSPTVITPKLCAARQSELEAEFDGSQTQINSMIASLIAGKMYDEPEIPRRRKEAIVFGQDWTPTGIGWQREGGRILVRGRNPPYDWMPGSLTIDEACEKFLMSADEMEEQIWALGDKLPLTFWALKRLGLFCSGGQAHLKSSNKTYARNDVLSIELNLGTLARPYVNPEIVIRSDDLSSTYRESRNVDDKWPRIDPDDRPRFSTEYSYPFFEAIQRQTAQTFGSGR